MGPDPTDLFYIRECNKTATIQKRGQDFNLALKSIRFNSASYLVIVSPSSQEYKK